MGMGRGDETFKAFLPSSFSILEDPFLLAAAVPIMPAGTWKRPGAAGSCQQLSNALGSMHIQRGGLWLAVPIRSDAWCE